MAERRWIFHLVMAQGRQRKKAGNCRGRQERGRGILIAVVVLIAALALLAGRRRLNKAYRLELDTTRGGVGRRPINPSNSSRLR